MKKFSKRRVFINDKEKQFQIFSFFQDKDGSIYCWWPEFENTNWNWSRRNETEMVIMQADTPGPGKFSIHGSGQTHFRSNASLKANAAVVVHGNHLLNNEKGSYGISNISLVIMGSCFPVYQLPLFFGYSKTP